MSMTSHDYNDIAWAVQQVLKRYDERAVSNVVTEVLESIAYELEYKNDNFDRAVFLAKCGIKI